MVTEEDYKREILAKYEADKSQFLREILQPSPARLKKWSIYLLDTLSADDKRVYSRFYKLNEVSANALISFDNDRLRPLTNFLKGKSELSDPLGLELLAVLINYENRPFSKFRTIKYEKTLQSEIAEEKTIEGELFEVSTEKPSRDNAIISNPQEAEFDIAEDKVSEENENADTSSSITEEESSVVKNYETEIIPQRYFTTEIGKRRRWTNRLALLLSVITLISITLFTLKDNFLKKEECMLWKEDHYEAVACDMQINTFAGNNIIPLNKDLLMYQRKINVCDTTTFFNADESPRVWYAKLPGNKCEFYSYPGKHPETGNDLKKITHHIIDRHVKKEVALKP